MTPRDLRIHERCPVCGGSAPARETVIRESLRHEQFSVGRCETCSARFITDPPSPSDIGRYYDNEAGARMRASGSGIHRSLRRFLLRLELTPLLQRLDRGTTVVDYGTGDGAVAEFLTGKGYQVLALDMYAEAQWPHKQVAYRQRNLNGTAVTKNDIILTDASGAHQAPSAVVARHVMEHLYEPRNVLEVFHDGGARYVLITAPNYMSRLRPFLGEYWYYWDPPRHLVHFTPKSLECLAKSCGYEVAMMKTYGVDEIITSLHRYALLKVEPDSHGRRGLLPILARFCDPKSAIAALSSSLAWALGNGVTCALLEQRNS